MFLQILTTSISNPLISPLLETLSPLLTHRCSQTQAHSAPARGWDIGRFERSDSCAVLQYEGSPSVRECEPWNHLQTFALSAPEHDDRSSQDIQIEPSSQWSSNLQNNDMLHPPTFRHQRQAPANHQRMRENPYSAAGNSTQHSRPQNQARSARSVYLPDSGICEHGFSATGGQQMRGSSASSTFSQTATSSLPMENNPAQFFDPRSAYPLYHPTINEIKRSHTGLSQDLEDSFRFDRGLTDESGHNSLPTSQDVLTPQELSWRQHDPFLFEQQLSTSAETGYGSYDIGFTANYYAWPPDFVQDPALGFSDSNTLDHPGAIKIGGSSHYKPDLPSSFPPSARCFPDYMPSMQTRAATLASGPTLLQYSPPKSPFPKNSNKPTSTGASRPGSLSIIREYGHPQHGSPNLTRNGSGKGKRKGPLPTATALAAAQKRKDGSVCIRCRTMKMTVGRCGRML